MSGVNYLLWCALCKKGYPSNFEWINHLLLPRHHENALQNCPNWDPGEVECCLVVFTGGDARDGGANLDNRKWIVKFISDLEGFRGGPVTDVLFHPENRNAMVLQVESRERVDRILGILDTSSKSVRGVPFELKKLAEYGNFERMNLFPWLQLCCHPNVPDTESQLIADFREVREAVEIPLDQFKAALDLMKRLQSILEKHLEGCQLFLFRHWYLRLNCPIPEAQELLIYVRHDHQFTNKVHLEYYQTQFNGTSVQTAPRRTMEPQAKCFVDSKTGLHFSLVHYGRLLAEMQTCQLVNHLCSLNLRAKGLMTVVRYWASQNQVLLQSDMVVQRDYEMCAPIPAVLEMLVIFFLIREKVVPTPESIATAPFDRDREERLVNSGFPLKPDWADNPHLQDPMEYKDDEFVRSVLELSQKFFQFYGDFLQNECNASACILNVRDGEIILVEEGHDSLHFRNMSGVKLTENVKTILATDWVLETFRKSVQRHLRKGVKMPMYVLHPLHHINKVNIYSHQLQQDWNKMKVTGEKLKALLNSNPLESSWKEELHVKDDGIQKRSLKRKFQ